MKSPRKQILSLLAELVKANYGAKCEPDKTFPWLSVLPATPPRSPLTPVLLEIASKTGITIGPRRAAKTPAASLIPVTAYFGPPLHLIFQFDEEAHLTPWRAKVLELYPPETPLNYDVAFCLERCRKRKTKASASATQKRQAFADALIDLLPPMHGLNPTLRIAQAELSIPRSSSAPRVLEARLLALLEKRLAIHAGTTFLQMLEHPSGKPWLPKLFA